MPLKPDSAATLQTFLDEIPRDQLAMSWLSSSDKRFSALGTAVLDPRHRSTSVVSLCKKYKIDLLELIEQWRQFNHSRGILKLSGHLPAIYEDVAIDAQSRSITCRQCQGLGTLFDRTSPDRVAIKCLECEGTGLVRVMGDKDARKLVFEVMGDVNKPSTTEVNIHSKNQTQNILFDNFRELISKTNKVIEITPQRIEGLKSTDYLQQPLDETAISDKLVIDNEIVEE